MHRLDDSWGICGRPFTRITSFAAMKTSMNVRSALDGRSSLYTTLRRADVHAPPARPAASGRAKLPTSPTSALVWVSWQPEIT